MKNFYLIFCLVFMLPALNLSAQKPITIMEDSLLVGKYMHPGISVTIPEVKLREDVEELDKTDRSRHQV